MLELLLSWLLNPFSNAGLQSLPFAALAGLGTLGANLYFKRSRKRTVISSLLALFIAFWIDKFIVFYGMPAHTGFLYGYFWLLVIALGSLAGGSISAWYQGDDDSSRYSRYDREPTPRKKLPLLVGFGGIAAIVGLLIVLGIVNLSMRSQIETRSGNAHITEAPASQTVPQTDPNHIVMVTQAQAYYAGRQIIANAGNNLGSRYETNQSDYTLQSVQKHLYWIAPLVYHSGWSQFQFWGQHTYDSPGYIVVDAEDPNGSAQVKTGFHIRYAPDGWFGSNLNRYIYTHGYDYGNIVDPTLEVDDNWQPFYTVALTQPRLTVTADAVVKVLVINVQSGDVQAYDPGKQPVWVDRILSSDMVKQLASDWGRYIGAPWINFGGGGEMAPSGDPELVYNEVDKPVWVIPMTSNNTSDSSATGLLLYDTTDQKGTYFPGIRGIGVGDAVSGDFAAAKENLQHYKVTSTQLYMINNTPTWVAIYDSTSGNSSFAAIGFMDARRLNTANVIFSTDKATALENYANWLAMNPYSNGGQVAQFGHPSGKLTGTIARISWVLINNQPTYYVLVDGDKHTYTATTTVNPSLPLMREGDKITYSYLDTDQAQQSLQSLSDSTINR